jgi:hypothetical protein
MHKTDQITTARQAAFLQRLTHAKERLLNSIADLDQATLCSEPVVGEWTVKDILGHLVSWNEEFRADIQMILSGQHPGYERVISGANDFNEWNQQWAARKRPWTWRHIRADFDKDCRTATQLILKLQPSDYRKRGVTPWKHAADQLTPPTTADTETVETLVTYHWRHINQHARMIERWRKRRARIRR